MKYCVLIGPYHLVTTLMTCETFPMIAARLGNLLLGLKDSTIAARTDIHVSILAL